MTFSISGCMNYPLPVKEPPEKIVDAGGTLRTNTPVKTDGGLDPAENRAGVLRNLELYEDSYRNSAVNFKRQSFMSGDATVLGGIIGVLGGLFDKSGAIYGGAGLAAGSSIYSQRYQFEVQSSNYFRASKAMSCLRNPVTQRDSMNVDEVTVANVMIDKVRAKLFEAQWEVKLLPPDTEALKGALKRTQENQQEKAVKQAQLASIQEDKEKLESQMSSSEFLELGPEIQQSKDREFRKVSEALNFKTSELYRASVAEFSATLDECVQSF